MQETLKYWVWHVWNEVYSEGDWNLLIYESAIMKRERDE